MGFSLKLSKVEMVEIVNQNWKIGSKPNISKKIFF